jgi:hypothetical protein
MQDCGANTEPFNSRANARANTSSDAIADDRYAYSHVSMRYTYAMPICTFSHSR